MNQHLTASQAARGLTASVVCALSLTGCGTAGPSGAGPTASGPSGPLTTSPTATKGVARTLRALDGVYVADVPAAELLNHGSPDALDENVGHFVFVFDNGINVQGQESAHACTWSVHSVTDDHHQSFTLSTLAAGGIAPNNANAKVGEPDVTMHWTLYRGVLTLKPAGPEAFWIKPFRQVSRTPTLSSFSPRCPPPASALRPG